MLCWDRVHPYLFPWVPRSVEQLVSILFWHSILLTSTTPLFRILNGHWRGESSLYYAISLTCPTWLVEYFLEIGFIHPGIDYARDGEVPIPGGAPVQGIDLGFALHAGAALTWLVCAYIQMVHTPKKWSVHRYFGYVAAFSFCTHVAASCFNLYMDVVQHKPLPRIMLAISSISSLGYLVRAIRVAVQKQPGWRNAHKDLMVLCFMVSTMGAGPIRMISHMQQWLGCGPVHCQNMNGGLATDCMWPYVFRMFWIQFYIMYIRGIYCKMRKDTELTLGFLGDLRFNALCLVAMIALSYIPYNEELLGVVLGSERSTRGTFTVFMFASLQLVANFIAPPTVAPRTQRRLIRKSTRELCNGIQKCVSESTLAGSKIRRCVSEKVFSERGNRM